MAKGRWAYMARPDYNPPTNDCPTCTEPSKTYMVGSKKVDGVISHRWRCEHQHEWIVQTATQVA